MRALLFHCKNYGVKIGKLSNRPKDITPEKVSENKQNCKDCVVVLVTVEKNDDAQKTSSGLSEEVAKMCQEVGKKMWLFSHSLIYQIISQKQKME